VIIGKTQWFFQLTVMNISNARYICMTTHVSRPHPQARGKGVTETKILGAALRESNELIT